MTTAAVFKSGRSQAIRLPKKYRFTCREVYVQPTPDGLLLTEKDPWDLFAEGVAALSEDFMATRAQPPLESREF
jgi:antitoxin VapB